MSYIINVRETYIMAIEKIIHHKTIEYTQAPKIAKAIDSALGNDQYFSKNLTNSGLNLQNNSILIKKHTLLGDIFDTLKAPFTEMPAGLLQTFLKGLNNIHLDGLSKKIAGISFIDNALKKHNSKKSAEIVENLLEQFTDGVTKGEINLVEQSEKFIKKASNGITSHASNYKARDERTLNRLATASVSAIYSSIDFYNISMLENDDKNKAKKAEQQRFKQEATRMGLSAALTFFSLGALEKYINKSKHAMILNAFVIAGSALFSEILSRIISKTPLLPLNPYSAYKIAVAKEGQNKKDDCQTIVIPNEIKQNRQKIFKDFQSNDNLIKTIQTHPDEIEKDNSVKKFWNKIIIAFIGASAVYTGKKILNGDISKMLNRKNIYNQNKAQIDKFLDKNLSLNKLDKSIVDEIQKCASQKSKLQFLNNIKKKITKKEINIDLDELYYKLETLEKSPEGKEIAPMIDIYKNHIDKLRNQGTHSTTDNVNRFLITGIYNGVTKIINTFYTILSAPVRLIDYGINQLFYKDSNDAINKIYQKIKEGDGSVKNYAKKYGKEYSELAQTFYRYREHADKNEKVASSIKLHTRNFKQKSETGELANFSRTLVTFISTYFFVNDYRNKVLIESKGKNVKEASEVTTERIAHKIFNFFFNGTLMNVFNSVFKVPLNKSLVYATMIAGATEFCNENLIRKSICQPSHKMNSRADIIKYEEDRLNQEGFGGWWTKTFKKLTGKKSLTQKLKN